MVIRIEDVIFRANKISSLGGKHAEMNRELATMLSSLKETKKEAKHLTKIMDNLYSLYPSNIEKAASEKFLKACRDNDCVSFYFPIDFPEHLLNYIDKCARIASSDLPYAETHRQIYKWLCELKKALETIAAKNQFLKAVAANSPCPDCSDPDCRQDFMFWYLRGSPKE